MAEKTSAEKLREIIGLDSELNKVQDVDILLERILGEARRVVSADAGSIYLKRGEKLVIAYAQNDTKSAELPPGRKLIYNIFTVPIDKSSISGYVAATGEPLNLPDVYEIPEKAPYSFKPYYDRIAQYRSKSTLTIPLKTNTGDLIGVIQVWNKKTSGGQITAFDTDDELMVLHFATNATVALQRAQMTRAILLRMIKMAELRDPRETGPHVNRVAGYAIEIYERYASQVGINAKEIQQVRDNLRMAAMLHDVGKVAISDVILKKPARFTDEEFEIMKTHTWLGARLFMDKQSEFDSMAQIVAFSHHEHWDGSGYPGLVDVISGEPIDPDANGRARGKRGEEIPLYGRIVSLADVYDALRSRRVYKEPWTEEDTLQEIRKASGTQFDPDLVDCFFDVLPSIRTTQDKYKEEPKE